MSGRQLSARARRARFDHVLHQRAFRDWLIQGPLEWLRSGAGFLIAYAALILTAMGIFRDPARGSVAQILALAGLTVLLLVRLFERVHTSPLQRRRVAEIELGTLFIAGTTVLVELTGGPQGLMYPLNYALVAFLVAFHDARSSAYFLALMIAIEAAITWLQPVGTSWRLFASHTSFLLLFAYLYTLFLKGEILQGRKKAERFLAHRLRSLADEARDFRLNRRAKERELGPEAQYLGSVQAIQESLFHVLLIGERALAPHTLALLWLDADGKQYTIKQSRGPGANRLRQTIAEGEGVLGAIAKRGQPLLLTELSTGHSGIAYYQSREPISEFAGVPVMEGTSLRGILIADRTEHLPFNDRDISLMQTIAAELVRTVKVEQILGDLDREHFQRECFYEASSNFNGARTVGAVANVAIETAKRVSDATFAAVAVATDVEGEMEPGATKWDGHLEASTFVGLHFRAEEGLVGSAIKARHPLPVGPFRGRASHIFSPDIDIKLKGVKVFPLLWKNLGVGALILGAEREDFLSQDVQDMLRVVADHAAIAIANAQMYERMERMATTDGLTNLANHRHFQDTFEHTLAKAQRYGRRVSLILTDIDHFKSINDTYGHPVGDQVLRRVAAILEEQARRTDIVARYGGEEFAVLMDETDLQGAQQMAERIRLAVERETFGCEQGTFGCTLSLGVATYPDDGDSKSDIVEGADRALYQAKHQGRNRTVLCNAVK